MPPTPRPSCCTFGASSPSSTFRNGCRSASPPTIVSLFSSTATASPAVHRPVRSKTGAWRPWIWRRASSAAEMSSPRWCGISASSRLWPRSIVATGFRLVGEPISTSAPGWRVKIDVGHSATKGSEQLPWQYYVASAPEIIVAGEADWDWTGPVEPGDGWQNAVPAPAAAARKLVPDRLPPQNFAAASPGTVVRTTQTGAEQFPARPVVVPAHSHVTLLLQRDAMISAYPALTVSQGNGARIKLSYSEALYDAHRQERRSQPHR